MQEIRNRITKATNLTNKITTATETTDPDGTIQNMIREDTVTDILAELLESLKAGESLEEAILTIHENF